MIGGAETQAKLICRYLCDQGCNVTVLTRHFKELRKHELLDGYTIQRIPAYGPGKIASLIFFCAAVLYLIRNSRSIDIIQASQMGVPAWCAVFFKILFKKPVVLKPEGMDLEFAMRNPWRRRITKLILKTADAFVAISKNHAEHYQRLNLPVEKLTHIHNAVEAPVISQVKTDAMERFGLPPGKINFTFTGRFEPVKGLNVLLGAWRKLPVNILKGSSLLIAGTGSLEEASQSRVRAEKIDNVIFLGQLDNVTDLLQISSVLINTSYYEGTSLSILEAMANGLAVIASDVAGNRELIRHGESGLLFAAGDENGLIQCIKKCFDSPNLRIKCGEGARQTFQENYDFAKNSIQYLELYKRLCGARCRCNSKRPAS